MAEFGLEALKSYGMAGFIILSVLGFSAWILHKVLVHFMGSIERKDTQLSEMGERFTASLDANTQAISEFRVSQQGVQTVLSNICQYRRG